MSFVDALKAANISPELYTAIDALGSGRKPPKKSTKAPAVPFINQFIDTELACLPAVAD